MSVGASSAHRIRTYTARLQRPACCHYTRAEQRAPVQGPALTRHHHATTINSMEILREILLTLHLVGMALIVGGYFTVIRSPKVLSGMLHASYLQLITRLRRVGIAQMDNGNVNHVKIGAERVVAISVGVSACIESGNQEADTAAGPDASAPAEGPAATAVKNPSATMAHLTFAFKNINP